MRRAGPWPVVLALTALGAGAGAAYSGLSPRTYTATAQLMVSPLPASDATFTGIAVFRDGGGRRAAAQSAAALVESAQAANAVALQFGGKRSRDALLAAVSAHVIGSSDVVAVTARSTSPAESAQIANAFAQALVAQRTGLFQSDLATAIQHDTQTLATLAGAQRAELATRLALLKTFVGRADPTIKAVAQAEPPPSARARDLRRALTVGAGAGLAASVLLALLLIVRAPARARRFLARAARDPVELDRLSERHESLLKAVEDVDARVAALERKLAAQGKRLERRAAELERALETPPAGKKKAPAARAPKASRAKQAPEARGAAVTRRGRRDSGSGRAGNRP